MALKIGWKEYLDPIRMELERDWLFVLSLIL
jgi:hypothetical protein